MVSLGGGFFRVKGDDGLTYLCRARGSLKRSEGGILPGDLVEFLISSAPRAEEPGEGLVERRLPRQSELARPPVANVDQVVVVASLHSPPCDWQLVSRILVHAEKACLSSLLCLNKSDLCTEEEAASFLASYAPCPYPVYLTSALDGTGVELLRDRLAGRCSVLAGPSGAGKSSLLNTLEPGLTLRTAPVSRKAGRGRHTTRGASLLNLSGGARVFDTPGFTRLDFQGIAPEELGELFPEFIALREKCSFRDCHHLVEPSCAVREASKESISAMRYKHYRLFMEELLPA